jgi:hypothetical protein
VLAVDSLYRSVRLLPNKLQYDYSRKKRSDEAVKGSTLFNRLLSDGSVSQHEWKLDDQESGKMTPLLPVIEGRDCSSSGGERGNKQEASRGALQALSVLSSIADEGSVSVRV